MAKSVYPTPKLTRGHWEATLRNIRAMKKLIARLERRVQRLERKAR